MFLHERKDLFKELLTATAEFFSVSEDIVEKDYYVFLILKKFNELYPDVVFKGGTSLSKCYKIINRFSEDIDITFTVEIPKTKRSKKIKHGVIDKIKDFYHFNIPNYNSKEAQGDCEVPKFHFETPAIADYSQSQMDPKVTLEISYLSPCACPKCLTVSCYVLDFIQKANIQISERYSDIEPLSTFEMNVQPMEITFIDKVYALCDYYLDKDDEKHSRHLYDIYKMFSSITYDEKFKELVKSIRKHRASLKYAFSTKPEQPKSIKTLVSEYTADDFYKSDYLKLSSYLIKDKDVSYDMLIDNIKKVVSPDFF